MVKSFRETHKKTNGMDVYIHLKNAIQFLVLKPGAKISEADLSVELGVSRTPIREALLRLSDDSLVDIYPQKGTYVSKIDLALAKEMAYMRHTIDTDICMTMCREKAQISELVEESLYLMQLALKRKDAIEYITNDDAFHRNLFSYGNHEAIWNIISSTRAHYIRVLVLDMMLPNSLEESFKDHNKIVECIESGDEEGLMEIMNVHHDHRDSEKGLQIKAMYPEYFI
jgi:GntR family transcriptional regulator, rspAB operon transcriptional repressor